MRCDVQRYVGDWKRLSDVLDHYGNDIPRKIWEMEKGVRPRLFVFCGDHIVYLDNLGYDNANVMSEHRIRPFNGIVKLSND